MLDVSGGEAEPVLVRKRSITAYAWAPDSGSIALLAPDEPDDEDERRDNERDDGDVWGERWQRNRLLRVSLGTGETTTLWAGDLHPVEMAWSPDGERLAVLARPTPELDDMSRATVWVLAANGAGEPRKLADVPFAGDLGWAGDGDRLVYTASHDLVPCSASTVWALPADGGEAVVIGPGRDETRCGIGVVTVPGEPRVVALVAEGLDSRLEWCDPATGEREVLWAAPGEVLDARRGRRRGRAGAGRARQRPLPGDRGVGRTSGRGRRGVGAPRRPVRRPARRRSRTSPSPVPTAIPSTAC